MGSSPFKRRADGRVKGLYVERVWPWLVGWDHVGPQWSSAERTRSRRWLSGTRRTKRLMRQAKARARR